MCLWFACFGLHKDDDISYAPQPNRSLPLPPPATKPRQYDRGYYHSGNGAHHQTPATAADEAGRKASNDARKGPAAHHQTAAVTRDAYAGAAAAVSRQPPAWNGRVAGEAGHGHGALHQQQQQQNYYHYYEREPVHRGPAMDHHYYTTTATATADHERY
ncbi:unnamed protein product [Urochloa humidicola]